MSHSILAGPPVWTAIETVNFTFEKTHGKGLGHMFQK